MKKLGDRKEGGGLISISAAFSPRPPTEMKWLDLYKVTHYPSMPLLSPLPSLGEGRDVLVLQPWLQHRGVNLLSLLTSLNTSHKRDCLLAFIARAVALLEKIHLAPIHWSFPKGSLSLLQQM